jgi:hypothetical protein
MNTAWSNKDGHPAFMLSPWNRLLAKLRPDAVIRHWGRKRHFTGKSFKVVDVYPTHLHLVIHAGGERKLTRHEFEKVASLWPEYLAGVVSRQAISSENTTYVFSLLKWLENAVEVAHV